MHVMCKRMLYFLPFVCYHIDPFTDFRFFLLQHPPPPNNPKKMKKAKKWVLIKSFFPGYIQANNTFFS